MKIAVCIKHVQSRDSQPRLDEARTWVRDQDAAFVAREVGASQDLRAHHALAVADEVGEGQLRAKVEVGCDVAARRREVNQGHLLWGARGDRHG